MVCPIRGNPDVSCRRVLIAVSRSRVLLLLCICLCGAVHCAGGVKKNPPVDSDVQKMCMHQYSCSITAAALEFLAKFRRLFIEEAGNRPSRLRVQAYLALEKSNSATTRVLTNREASVTIQETHGRRMRSPETHRGVSAM